MCEESVVAIILSLKSCKMKFSGIAGGMIWIHFSMVGNELKSPRAMGRVGVAHGVGRRCWQDEVCRTVAAKDGNDEEAEDGGN